MSSSELQKFTHTGKKEGFQLDSSYRRIAALKRAVARHWKLAVSGYG